GAQTPLKRLKTRLHIFVCELEVLARHVASRTRSAIAVNVGEAQREESGSYRCVTILGRGRHVLGDTARHRCQKHSCYLQTNVCFHCFCHSWIILLGWNTPEHFDYGYCAGLV